MTTSDASEPEALGMSESYFGPPEDQVAEQVAEQAAALAPCVHTDGRIGPVGRCDQLTQRGDRCQRTATVEAWVLRGGRLGGAGWERFCSQHANYYGVLRHRRCRPVSEAER